MMIHTKFPLVYEINTRIWLAELSEKHQKPLTLATVPETEFRRFVEMGVDTLWLMGVWQESPLGQLVAQQHEGLQADYRRALPDVKLEDVGCSPYCISDYTVSEKLGGNHALELFRQRLAAKNIKLMLDFVPNHVALDHGWTLTHPDYFIERPSAEDAFGVMQTDTTRYFANGRDPYFPPWTDVLQLNYANPALREAMTEVLKKIAKMCDAVRCDMAMLMLKEVFNSTWQGKAAWMTEDFWPKAIDATKRINAEFQFVAEAYWDTEWQLQQQGFDFTYDKRLYDRLHASDAHGVNAHFSADWNYQQKLCRFVENHDEPRVASDFGQRAKVSALVALTAPGMRLMHEGQELGRKVKTPVQLLRRPHETDDHDTVEFYQKLFRLLKSPAITKGESVQIPFQGTNAENIVLFSRVHGSASGRVITIANLGGNWAEVYFFTSYFSHVRDYEHVDVISTSQMHSPQFDLWNGGITIRLRGYEGLAFLI